MKERVLSVVKCFGLIDFLSIDLSIENFNISYNANFTR